MPSRIQRRRVTGWRLPAGATYVGRPSRWGNPFRVAAARLYGTGWSLDYLTHDAAIRASVNLFSAMARGLWNPDLAAPLDGKQYRNLMGDRAAWLRRLGGNTPPSGHPTEIIRAELGWRDLACWCPLPEPGQPDHCHAGVLLELANGAPR